MIIGLTGIKGSGKTYFAEKFAEDFDFQLFNFADHLKEVLSKLLHLENKELWDPEFKRSYVYSRDLQCVLHKSHLSYGEDHITIRELMQEFGTEFVQSTLGKDFWIKQLENDILNNNAGHAIIGDVRFNHEWDWIEKQGGIIVRVENPNIISEDFHSSEIEVGNRIAHYEIFNDYLDNPNKVENEYNSLYEIIHINHYPKYYGQNF